MTLRSLALVTLLLAPSAAEAQLGSAWDARPTPTLVAPVISAHLARIQRDYDKETATCLGGRVSADSTEVTAAWPAEILLSEKARVQYRCEIRPGFIGAVHNHPPGTIGCAVSVADLSSFAQDPNLLVTGNTCLYLGDVYLVLRRRDRSIPEVVLF